ncbi:hypothetical protein BATDEDRAFT_85890 [Batrachochytrium dendrobatidis JAM81]|uniref:PX domain-containing protein n=1 Tax=Batrachochytrium dendrobatidis (strain JAM81 / FGSC 10211) TaxID=684364 RepID=F4NS43_BATDJ|nr:uncharacterized protein BATDEDRAFT_85890 [Batrachochytrium dendrobatidis JAM81]EGF83394.1 hypothetical protein BATDEDRAFT_85890 [Batrachochytrium dendrobatidis JAM81]|eukprot:XP_006676087.1 hypothetical protein BATDEDRAFT_85890 [Batrachochytrium dendrobatidis JAM81]
MAHWTGALFPSSNNSIATSITDRSGDTEEQSLNISEESVYHSAVELLTNRTLGSRANTVSIADSATTVATTVATTISTPSDITGCTPTTTSFANTAFEFGLPTPKPGEIAAIVGMAGMHPPQGLDHLLDRPSTSSSIVTRTPKPTRALGFKESLSKSGVEKDGELSHAAHGINHQYHRDEQGNCSIQDGQSSQNSDTFPKATNAQSISLSSSTDDSATNDEIDSSDPVHNITINSWLFPRTSLPTQVPHPRYSFMITSETADGPLMDLVTVYRAEVLFDYTPTTFVDPDGSGDNAVTPISLTAGEIVSVFGNNSVGFTDTATGEFWRSSRAEPVHHNLDIVSDVNVSGGWCHVERKDGQNGYAPIAYLKFETPELAQADDLPERANLRNSAHGLVIDSKPHHRLSAGNYLTSFPAPPTDPSLEMYLDNHQTPPIALANILSSAKVGTSFQSMWSSIFQNNNALREFILRGPVVDPSAVIRQRIQSTISTYNSPYDRVMSVIPSCYVIESKNNGTMHWKPQIEPFKVSVHSPRRCRRTTASKREEFVLYKITTMFVSNRADEHDADTSVTVERRYNDFTFLHSYLETIFPVSTVVTLPAALPPRHSTQSRFDEAHVNERRRGLQLYLDQISRHPIFRSEDIVMQFLTTCSIETDLAEIDEGHWPLDSESSVVSANSGEWRLAYDIPRISNPTYSFFEHVIVPETAAYNSLSLSTFKLRGVESISDALANRLSPFIDATLTYQSHIVGLHDVYLKMSDALLSTGRLLSRTGDNQPGCWNPSCNDCGLIGDAMIAASLQLKHISDVHQSHGTRSLESFVQSTKQIKSAMSPLRSLTNMFKTVTKTVLQQEHQKSGLESVHDPALESRPSANSGLSHSTTPNPNGLPEPRLFSRSHPPNQQSELGTHRRPIQARSELPRNNTQQRAAVVLAVAESEAVQAHSEKMFMIEDAMSTWLDGEIEMHEKLLKRLRAAKEIFRGPNQRL